MAQIWRRRWQNFEKITGEAIVETNVVIIIILLILSLKWLIFSQTLKILCKIGGKIDAERILKGKCDLKREFTCCDRRPFDIWISSGFCSGCAGVLTDLILFPQRHNSYTSRFLHLYLHLWLYRHLHSHLLISCENLSTLSPSSLPV